MKRLQNKIAESRMTLSTVAVIATLIAIAIGAFGMQLGDGFFRSILWWEQLLVLTVSTMLMVELNNANSLIRIFSRMVSCSFLLLTLMASFLYPSLRGGIVGLAFIVFLLSFLHAYQNRQAVGSIYTAFLALGVGSLFFVRILYFVPLFWLLMAIRLYALSWRTFFASLLGLLTPYWLLLPYYLYIGDFQTPLDHFSTLGQFMPLTEVFSMEGPLVAPIFTDPALLLTPHSSVLAPLFTLLFVILLALTGAIHFLRRSSNDKLRTQMIYEMFIIITLFIVVFIILQPQHLPYLLRLLIISTAPLIGHFLALTRTKVTNIAFFLIVAATFLLTAYNVVFS